MVVVFSDTSVTVSWNVLDISIDYYTVVYSRVSQQQNEEMSAVFSSPATSGVITDLDSTAIYQFQVFATVTVSGKAVDGERSIPVYFTRPCNYMYSNALLTTINDTCIMCDTVEYVCIRRLSCIMYHEVYMMLLCSW